MKNNFIDKATDEMRMLAIRQCIGIPSSAGVSEPIEGFYESPQDLAPAIRDMALKIEILEKQLEEAKRNDLTAMKYLSEVRDIVGGKDFPDMILRIHGAELLYDAVQTLVKDPGEDRIMTKKWSSVIYALNKYRGNP